MRDYVPERSEDQRSRIIKERIDYMDKYIQIIFQIGRARELYERAQTIGKEIEKLDREYVRLSAEQTELQEKRVRLDKLSQTIEMLCSVHAEIAVDEASELRKAQDLSEKLRGCPMITRTEPAAHKKTTKPVKAGDERKAGRVE